VGKKIGILVVGLVLGVLAGWGLAHLPEDGGGSPTPDRGRAYAPVAEPEAARLATRFRPRLMFDSGERWRPISIESLLAEREEDGDPLHAFCKRSQQGTDCEPIDDLPEFEGLVSDNSAQGVSTYVDISGKELGDYRAPRRSPACQEARLLDCDDDPSSAIYYRVTSSNERFYIDYWWFMRFNHFALTSFSCAAETVVCGEHEGDWEGVTLVTVPNNDEQLDYVVYAAHNGTFRYPAQPLISGRGEHPEVFVANGSHASYPKPCSGCWQPISFAGVNLPEASTDGKRPWARNGDACLTGTAGSCLRPLPVIEPGRFPWTTWSGLWGSSCGSRCGSKRPQAPASPGLQARFQYPWCSIQSGALTCDTTAPGCSDWLGPGVAALACNPVAVGRGLSAPEELPSGGLELTVTPRDGKARQISPTTKGIVQVLGAPLRDGDALLVSDAGKSTEILVRAQEGRRLLEARFSPFVRGDSGKSLKITVASTKSGVPVLRALRADGDRVPPLERRRISVPRPG
jgi:Vacuolar protein sorting-associated protein 62